MQRHTGEDKILIEKRKETYKKAQKEHPERWSKNTRNWVRGEDVYLNPDRLQDPQQNTGKKLLDIERKEIYFIITRQLKHWLLKGGKKILIPNQKQQL